MLIRMLKSLARGADEREQERSRDETPFGMVERLERVHAAAPIDKHLQIAFGGLKIGERELLELVGEALAEAQTGVAPRKRLHRPLASLFLAQHYIYALGIEGRRAECGVFAGASALIACRAARTRIADYSGADLHLIDSFEGLAAPTQDDRFEGPGSDDAASFGRGAYRAPIEIARRAMQDFPGVSLHKGWIPDVFSELPESKWAFVHLDVDHYAPTHAALEYFYPRLSAGGVIICDDYGSATFPGAQRAWHRYCDDHAVPFVLLDTGQSVILKGPG